MDISLPIETTHSDVTFKDIIDWKRTRGVQGEDCNFLTLVLGLLFEDNRKQCLHIGIEGYTGSSKSYMTDQCVNHKKYGDDILFPVDTIEIISGGSDKSLIYNSRSINGKKILYFEEINKIASKENAREVIKNLSENKNADYITPQEKFTIYKGITIVYCLAINNTYENDDEMTRRFITLDTDISDNLTDEVVANKLDMGFFKEENVFITAERTEALKSHIYDCMLARDLKFDFRNPFFSKSNSALIPKPDINIRSFIEYFTRLMQASGIFHHKTRVIEGNKLILNLQDVYNIALIFGDQFVRDIHGLPSYAQYIMQAFSHVSKLKRSDAKRMKESASSLTGYVEQDEEDYITATANDLHRTLNEIMGIHLNFSSVCSIIKTLTDLNFLTIDTLGKKSTYALTGRKVKKLEIDFREMFEQGKQNMQKKYPELYERWLETNKELYHPLTGEILEGFPTVSCDGGVSIPDNPVRHDTSEERYDTHEAYMEAITEDI